MACSRFFCTFLFWMTAYRHLFLSRKDCIPVVAICIPCAGGAGKQNYCLPVCHSPLQRQLAVRLLLIVGVVVVVHM